MNLDGILPFARLLLEKVVKQGDIAVDATAGNGHDSLYLANLVGQNGHVYSFDIQKEAIENSKKRLSQHSVINQVTFIHDGHQNVKDYIKEPIRAAIFNLGYLPGGNKTIVTKPNTTIQAVENLFDLLLPGGVIVLVIYHGHEEGETERNTLLEFTSSLSQDDAYVLKYEFLNQRNNPPFIIAIEKKIDKIRRIGKTN